MGVNITVAEYKRRGNELSLQTALCHFLDIELKEDLHYFAIPNGDLRLMRVAVRLKASGVKPGVADICVMLPKGKVAWLELKTATGSQSKSQKGFEARCQRLNHRYAVVKSLEGAKAFLDQLGALK